MPHIVLDMIYLLEVSHLRFLPDMGSMVIEVVAQLTMVSFDKICLKILLSILGAIPLRSERISLLFRFSLGSKVATASARLSGLLSSIRLSLKGEQLFSVVDNIILMVNFDELDKTNG